MHRGTEFVLIIDGEGLESAVNTAHISHIKKDIQQMSGHPLVTAKILGVEARAILCAGPEAHGYFEWLKEILPVRSYWEEGDDAVHESEDDS